MEASVPVSQGLYYFEYHEGEIVGPPILLLHGAGGTHLSWPPEVRRLKGGHVFALDLPGHGRSEQQGGMQQIEAYARSVSDWMAGMDLPAAVVIGHSLGGAVALKLAAQNPDQVSALGLIATSARFAVNPALLGDAANPTTFHRATANIVRWSFAESTSPKLSEMALARMNESRPSVLVGDLQACERFDACDLLGAIQIPTLVVCGKEDRMTPLRQSQYLADSIPGARLEVVQNAGHMVMLEQPTVTAQLLRSFARSLVLFPGEE